MADYSKRVDYDGHWKRIIGSTFQDFLSFFAPDLAELVEWRKEPDDLNRELQKLHPQDDAKNRKADNLYKVYLKDGRELCILVHIEVQGWEDSDFDKRMFQYFYRIFEKYGQKIYALAIYTEDLKAENMPEIYKYEYFGTELTYKFNTFKVIDQDEEELLESSNPFSYVVLSAKRAILSKAKNDDVKYQIKKSLLEILSKRKESHSLDEKYVAAMVLFMDNIIKLSEELQTKFKQEEIEHWEGGLMLSYEEDIKNEGKMDAIKVIKLLIEKKSVEEIARQLRMTEKEVLEIKDQLPQL